MPHGRRPPAAILTVIEPQSLTIAELRDLANWLAVQADDLLGSDTERRRITRRLDFPLKSESSA